MEKEKTLSFRVEKGLLSENYSWKQDIEIRVKRKKSNRQVDG